MLWLVAGLVVASLAAVVAYMTLSRAAQAVAGDVRVEGAVQQVVVSTQPIGVRVLLTDKMLTTQEMPVEAVPQGAVSDPATLIGKLTMTELYTGEIILEQRLADPTVISGDGRVAVALATDEVLMAVPADDLMSQVSVLKPGDKVDILVSMQVPSAQVASASSGGGTGDEEEEQVTFAVLENVSIAALPGTSTVSSGDQAKEAANQTPAKPQALLVTLAPQDALLLKYALDAGAIKDVVLRAPGADQRWGVEPVNVDYMIDALKLPVR